MPRTLVVAVLVFVGCSQHVPAGPTVLTVLPQSANNDQAVELTISGRGFWAVAKVNYDSPTSIDQTFVVTLDEYPLQKVTLVSSNTLRATVPAGLPLGVYRLTLVDPRKRQASLASAFTLRRPTALDGGADADFGRGDLGRDSTKDVGGDLQADGVNDGPTLDKRLTPDALPVDRPDCTNGCVCAPGSDCQIDCSQSNCPSIDCGSAKRCTILCEGNYCKAIDCGSVESCHIDCGGGSCTGAINCGTANCDVLCRGNACKDTITCAAGKRCNVVCQGTACQKPIDCNGACACSANCGSRSCVQHCPTGCDTASGCSTTLPGCDSC
jgi:hypothetical protein